MLIDDAQYLNFGVNGQELNQRVHEFSSLATVVGKTHILFGTYDLWEFAKILEQSEHPTLIHHFPRYYSELSEDIKAFMQVVFSFQCHLPLQEMPNLIQNIEYVYSGSLGCVGVLHSWLYRALVAALDEGCSTLTLEHLETTILEKPKLLQMAREIADGEAAFALVANQSHRGKRSNHPDRTVLPNVNHRKRKRRVGERNPKRDKVGRNK